MDIILYTISYCFCFVLGAFVSGGISLPHKEKQTADDENEVVEKLTKEWNNLLAFDGNRQEDTDED